MSRLLRRAPICWTITSRAFSTTQRAELARMSLIGRLGTQPELVATSTGQPIVRYILASDHGPRDNRQTSWFRVAAFLGEGPQRDRILNLQKGTLVYVDADATMGVHEDAETQKKISRLNLYQKNLEVISRPRQRQTEEPSADAAEGPVEGV